MFFIAAAFLAVGRAGAHHPFQHFGSWPTLVTMRVSRWLPEWPASLVSPPSQLIARLAVAAVVIVAVLDGVDGWLARRSNEISRLEHGSTWKSMPR